MMCAFMTPVLKSDWEVYDSKVAAVNSKNPNIRQNGSATELQIQQHRAQQLMRLRQIQHTRRQLLGTRSQSYTAPASAKDLLGGPRAYHLSANTSRVSLPISPLATERGRPRTKKSSSSNSLNNFHNKVIVKLKNVLHIRDKDGGDSPDGSDEGKGDSSTQQPQSPPDTSSTIQPQSTEPQDTRRSRRSSRPSSRSSFDIPNIAEEVVDGNGALVAA